MLFLLPIVCCFLLLPTWVVAQDSIRQVIGSEVVVTADPLTQPWRLDRPVSTTSSVDDLMRFSGLNLIQRASGFAGELSVMGLRGAQVTTTIDGMKIHAACVDKMDPATAYIEVDNLSSLNVRSDGSDLRYGQSLGGSVNFMLQQPRINSPLHSTIDGSFESNSLARRLRVEASGGSSNFAMRVGYTGRGADNMVPGNHQVLSSSGYTKHNLTASAILKITHGSELLATIIADRATDVGYPALIMDTRKADALIAALTWKNLWSNSFRTSAKVYANTIDHTMDDFDRSVPEVRRRSFMPNMYMPMYGTTRVAGVLGEATYSTEQTTFNVIVDGTYLQARATMDMVPLDSGISRMALTNLGDARISTIGCNLTVDHSIDCDMSIRAGARIDVSHRSIADDRFRSVFSGYFPNTSLDNTVTASSVNAGLYYNLTPSHQIWGVLAYSERLPTQLELYGFWLYDPQANIINNGRPDLKNESAVSITMGNTLRAPSLTCTTSAFARSVNNYIAPNPATTELVAGKPPIRTIGNIGAAILWGFDVSVNIPVNSWCTTQAMIRGLWAQSTTYNEPLPLINPITTSIRTVVGTPTYQAELTLSAAAAQTRISTSILSEDRTPSWFRADALVAWQVIRSMRLQFSCTNLLDTYYHEHTSINNMPNRGRSFNAGLRVDV